MDYAVFVSAEGASMAQVASAQHLYREALDRGVGGSGQVRPCFAAYTKLIDQHPLNPAEQEQAAAWIAAEQAAREHAAAPLPKPADAVFTFRLIA
jgi:hypothetical protein